MYTEDLPGVAEVARDLRAQGVPNVTFLGLPISPGIGALIASMIRLRRMVRREGYQVVETSSITTTVIAAWALRGTSVRHIFGVHGIYQKSYRNIREAILRFSLWANPRIGFYAVSQFAMQAWLAFYPSATGKVRRVYNAIPGTAFFAKPDRAGICRELGLPEGGRLFVFVGRLIARKGVTVLLDAVSPILQERNAYLLLVGAPDPSPDMAYAAPETMVRDLSTRLDRLARYQSDTRIRILGFRDDVQRLMASADLMIHPPFMEAFGLVLAEAMAAGVPIVASDVDGIPEVLEGTDYRMVPPGDATALRAAIVETLDRPGDEVVSSRERARRRANDFHQSRRTKAMIELYRDMV
jgi:glycosyltransferase involved in cell wall biosynthesis